jgi:hypothetical protein
MSKKTGTKQERKRRGKTKGDKKSNQKRRKGNKTLNQKAKRGRKNKKTIKKKEPKIMVLAYKLLTSTLTYLMLAPW